MKIVTCNISGDGFKFRITGCEADPITKYHIRSGTFYEKDALSRMSELAAKLISQFGSGYIVDGGANIGNHSLYFGAANSRAKVYAFEMNPYTFRLLDNNVRESALDNIEVFNRGLSEDNGFCGVKENRDNPLGGAQLDFSDSNGSSVRLVRLDDWARDFQPDDVCVLIKLDVEGHELQALRGAYGIIKESNPLIFLEIKEIDEFKAITRFLSDLGYIIAYAEKGALPNFLFVHKDRVSTLFSERELWSAKESLCLRVVETWQLHRELRKLRKLKPCQPSFVSRGLAKVRNAFRSTQV